VTHKPWGYLADLRGWRREMGLTYPDEETRQEAMQRRQGAADQAQRRHLELEQERREERPAWWVRYRAEEGEMAFQAELASARYRGNHAMRGLIPDPSRTQHAIAKLAAMERALEASTSEEVDGE